MTQEEFFKRYKYDVVDDRIGGGGFGTVYKAYDTTLHREVAIKVSEVKTVNGKTFSLRDEVEALTHVPEHPNIANYEKEKLFTFKTPQGVFDYAVMQFYPDGNLSNAIKQGLTSEQKDDIATQLLEGIAFLHQHKVVHRDLKPGNILVVRDGDKVIPLITDFGLSKAANVGDASVFTNSFGGGTPRYSSPEQLQGQPLRLNTDLWSFGAILYEVFTGHQLFSPGSGAANTAQADLEIFNKIVHGDVQNLGRMPEKWRKVAERCLVVDPGKRAKSAEELLTLLREDEEETEVTTGAAAGHKPSKPAPKPPQKKADQLVKTPKQAPVFIQKDTSGSGKSKKGLWIGLAVLAAAALLLVLLLKPKEKPVGDSLDTQTFNACSTVQDYRNYISDYGRNSEHFSDAKAFIDQYLADSAAKAQQALTDAQARQQAEAEVKAQAEAEKKEDAAYKKCTTVAACESYLKAYPKGRYVEDVKKTKAELEAQSKAEAGKKGGNGNVGGHEYVDLGLPSGTLWATCNVGANKPEGYGNYFAWGETSTKSTYNWDTYKYAKGNYDKLTKYCNSSSYGNNGFTDNLTTLQGFDDPAAVIWGSGWRTPSKAQWDELLANTTNQWTTKNGVKGRQFTSKRNGEMLFLPAAGYRWDNELGNAGSRGYYWSRSLDTDGPNNAWCLYFNSDYCSVSYDSRYGGFAVRPVREK